MSAAVAGGAVAGAGMAASMVSAQLITIDPPVFPPISFSYNPSDYSEVTEGKWSSRLQPVGQGPPPQWQGIQPQKISVPILLDAFAIPPPDMPPTVVIDVLKQLLLPTAISQATGSACPPIVMLQWGANIIMDQAYVTKVTVKYERFLLGMPVRCTATVDLQAVPLPAPLGPTNPTSGGLATRRTRTMVEGDTLASIAHQEYRDPNKWRALAEANNIDDPMRVKDGTVLIVPDRREAEALS